MKFDSSRLPHEHAGRRLGRLVERRPAARHVRVRDALRAVPLAVAPAAPPARRARTLDNTARVTVMPSHLRRCGLTLVDS